MPFKEGLITPREECAQKMFVTPRDGSVPA